MCPSPEDAGLLTGLQQAVDAVAVEAERKWGVGRAEQLAGLADPNLLARFRRQQATWREALQAAWEAEVVTADLLATVQAKAGSMQRAWRALDAHAEEAGHRPVAPWVWEVPLADGSIAAFVQTAAEASKVITEGRHVQVLTAAEVGRIIDALDRMTATGQTQTGKPPARRKAKPLPNDLQAPPFDPIRGDEIPFGDPQPTPPALAEPDAEFPSVTATREG